MAAGERIDRQLEALVDALLGCDVAGLEVDDLDAAGRPAVDGERLRVSLTDGRDVSIPGAAHTRRSFPHGAQRNTSSASTIGAALPLAGSPGRPPFRADTMAPGRDNCLSRAVTKRTGFVISRGHDLVRRGAKA